MATPTVFPILPLNTEGQELTPVDVSSVSTITLQNTFDVNTDVIQAYLYDINNNVISRLTTNYSVTSGNVSGSTITELNLDPAADLQKNNYTQGTYNINYNFLSALVQGNPLFRIQEISSTRTELRVYNSSFTSTETQQVVDSITAFLSSTPTFQGYYLDFGLDTVILGVNIAADNNSILIKLYEPLPDTYGINTVFNLVEKKAEPVAYNVSFPQEEVIFDSTKYLRGPNFNLRNSQQSNASTDYETYGSLFNGTTTLTNQLKSVLAERRAELNTDYTSLPNFVFFSSAEQRLINFYEKASLIEEYTNQIDILNTLTLTNEVSASKAYYQQKIDDLIVNFDGYDYFLYFDSGSKSWPKSNSTKPYTLYSTGSSEVLTWYPEQINSGSLYDSNNQNYIYNIYPVYITEDTDNEQFRLFNEMVAQMFDQVWMYTKAIENRQSGDNRLSEGISIDLAADALRSYGVSLYESSFANVDLYTTYLGITPEGSTLPPTGSEWITNYVTASADTTPFNDAQKLIYKRLYHNLPYLLKKKGTISGLRVLLNCFGIPDTILKINEFGGKDKNTNTWDNWQYQFNYAYRATGSNYISSSFVLNSAWAASNNRPSSVAFRFKPETNYPTLATQSLWTLNSGQVKITLEYTGSGTVSGSYSGSITNPYSNYGTLKFVVNSTTSASLYLPFFNGDWWSVLVTSGSSDGYTLYAKSNTFGNTVNNTIGFQASSCINTVTNWSGSTTSSFGNVFSGSFQELRYYKAVLNELAFNDYVMNPSSIEGNSTNSSPEELVFRAILGSELYTGSISVHPKNTGTWTTTSSFVGTSNFYYSNPPTFNTNYEYVYFDQPPVGIQNPVNSKIQNQTIVLPPTASTQYSSNKVLSANISVQQNTIQNQDYTADINYVEIALSPTNEINDDINSSLGYFNLGEYIGDPRQISSSAYSYPALDSLSQNYFQKYSESYNWNDFIRIVKYFDNAVFRMLKDFIPARAGVATGVVIKQHLLERNRQRPAQVSYSQLEYTGSVTSLARDYQTGSIEVFTGGPGGSVDAWLNISQSWSSSIDTKAGIVNTIQSSEYEFYNGEYSGSNIPCHLSYSLNTTPLLNNVSSSRLSTFYEDVDYNSDAFNPVNLLYIQSGSASLAPVQDSNYAHTSSWTITRYEGSQNTGIYNTTINFASQSQAPGYPIDKFTNYFARFSYDASSDPEYPGGGVFKLVELINVDGTRIPLTGDNNYLSFVSEIFKAGKTVTAYGRNISVIKTVTDLTVVEGAGYYQTMLLRSGSTPVGLNIGWSSGVSTGAAGNFVSSSTSILTDSASIGNTGFIYTLQNSSSATYGTMVYMYPQSGVQVYNKATDSYVIEGGAGNTWNVAYEDTLFPLKYGDFIRFGNTGSYSFTNTGSLDDTFTGAGLYYISRVITGSDVANSGSIIISPNLEGESTKLVVPSAINNQNYRLIRRVESETWVTTKIYADMNVDPATGGLLIPNDFNPAYDPITVARQAGIEL